MRIYFNLAELFNVCCNYSYERLWIPLVSLYFLSWLGSLCNSPLRSSVSFDHGGGEVFQNLPIKLHSLSEPVIQDWLTDISPIVHSTQPLHITYSPSPTFHLLFWNADPCSIFSPFVETRNLDGAIMRRNPLPQAAIRLWSSPCPQAGLALERALGIFHSGYSSPLPTLMVLIHVSPHDNLMGVLGEKPVEVWEPPTTLAP